MLEFDPAQAFEGGAADHRLGIGRGSERLFPRVGLEIGEAQLDAHRAALATLRPQISGHRPGQGLPAVDVVLKGDLAAVGLGLPVGDQGAFINPVRRPMQEGPMGRSKRRYQPFERCSRQVRRWW